MASLVDRIRARLAPSAHRPLLPRRPTRGDIARRLLPPDLVRRCEQVQVDDAGHGFDPFGMSHDGVLMGVLATRFLYERWFRVDSHGVDRIPAEGPVVVAVNHSGMLPLDALMIAADVIRQGPTGRVARVAMDHFVPDLPFVASVFTGAGGFGGSRGNSHAILARGGLLLVFPEGVPGIGKPFSRRYQLQPFREGHAEIAIQHQAPIVPCAVIGAEEQWPQLLKIPFVKAFGAPYLPVPATPLPLPVRYHLWYGDPIDVPGRFAPDDAHDPQAVHALAREVQAAVAALIAHGLEQREGLFS